MVAVTAEQCEIKTAGMHGKLDQILGMQVAIEGRLRNTEKLQVVHLAEHDGRAQVRMSFRAWVGIILATLIGAGGVIVGAIGVLSR